MNKVREICLWDNRSTNLINVMGLLSLPVVKVLELIKTGIYEGIHSI